MTDSIAERYRGTRYAESALYLWRRWSGRSDERTALLDSLLANPDTSRMAWFEPDSGLKIPGLPDTSLAARQAREMAAADSARLDSMSLAAQQVREKFMKEQGAGPVHPQMKVIGPMPQPDPGATGATETTQSPQPNATQAPSARAAPPAPPPPAAVDPKQTPAPSDSTGAEEDDAEPGQ